MTPEEDAIAFERRLKKRKRQREWKAARRAAYFADKSCVWLTAGVRCASVEMLELDHIVREGKIDSDIWSWRESRRLEELAKCQVLCKKHHKQKTAMENTKP